MILVCPSCKASYLVPASTFSGGARKVRCARCGNDWQADLPSRMTAIRRESEAPPASSFVRSAPPQPEHAPGEALPPVANLPTVWKAPTKERLLKIAKYLAMAIALCSFLGLALLYAKPAAHAIGKLFEASAEAPAPEIVIAPGFSMQHVRSERRYQDGSMQLVVDGELHFDGTEITATPDIHVAALGPDGKKITEWTLPAPLKTMSPGQITPFNSAVNTPEGTIVEINLSFIPQPKPHDP